MSPSLPVPAPLPGLNGVRAIAVLLVMLHHIEIYKFWIGFPSLFQTPVFHGIFFQFGPQGVRLFFVLSGFLITHLLLREQNHLGKIRVKAFYCRRMLRIWPLYYLMVLFAFFLMPHSIYPPTFHVDIEKYLGLKLAGFVFMAPNLVLSAFGAIFPIFPLWSIGIEEQFYLFWPHLMNKFRPVLFKSLGVFVLVCIALKTIGFIGERHFHLASHPLAFLPFRVLFEWIRFDVLAMGGMTACIMQRPQSLLGKKMISRSTQIAAIVILLGLMMLNFDYKMFDDLVYSLPLVVIIYNVANNPSALIQLRQPWLDFLGRISYGLYVYHTLVFFMLLRVLKPIASTVYFQPLIYLGGFSITICIAWLSFRFFESPFLSFKKHFA